MPIDDVTVEPASTLHYVGKAVPYTYLGDSHCGPIGTMVLEDAAAGVRIVTRLAGIWRFVASDVLSGDGMIGEQLMQTLRRGGAFHSSPSFPPVAGLRPVETLYGRAPLTEFLALMASANERPYVMTVGEINNRYLLQRLVDDELDFDLPFRAEGLERLPEPPSRAKLRVDQLTSIFTDDFAPLFRGLRVFRDAGFRSIYLHSIPPPAVDDEDAARVLKHRSPARLRYKIALFANFLYERVCRDLGVGFINTWPMVTEGNLLKSEYYLDGLHLNHQHSLLSVNEVHRQFTALRSTIESENLAKAD